MSYNASTSSTGTSATTEIYVNRDLHYPHGLLVTVNGVEAESKKSVISGLNVQCRENQVLIFPTAGAQNGEPIGVDLTITRCLPTRACSCRI